MERISRDLKIKSLRYAIVTVFMLVALIVVLSYYHKTSKTVINNTSLDPTNVQEKIIFGDIKIKINSDIFSYDQIYNEVKETKLIAYLNKNVNKGDTAIYVSQDVGVQQLLIAKLISQSGRIYILNPFEKYNNSIELSAKANGFENRIFTETSAISDKSFEGFLIYQNTQTPEHGIIKSLDYKLEKGYCALKTKVSSLDNLYPNLQNVNILRISSPKDSINAINGATQIIRRSPNIKIILDYDKEIASTIFEKTELKELDFKIYSIGEEGKLSPLEEGNSSCEHIVLQRN